MTLTIITINYNNAAGLAKTMDSVLEQSFRDFEYVIVDGGSKDGSRDVIASKLRTNIHQETKGSLDANGIKVHWVSEPDKGIYNAMNKGIKMAQGKYVQFLNSGDFLATPDVTEKMLSALNKDPDCAVFYGNMIKEMKPGKFFCDRSPANTPPTMLNFYKGTINHSPAYIRRNLFEQYGLYDENLKIVSDWKWYLQVIGLHAEQAIHTNIDVTIFDMTGISNTNTALEKSERRKVLEELLPPNILADYDKYAMSILETKRIKKYWLTRKLFWLSERVLFKFEKWKRV